MFRNGKGEYKNGLVDQLRENPDLPLDKLLSHPDLPATVRNDAAALVDYLQRPVALGWSRLSQLLQYALPSRGLTPDSHNLWALSRNASVIFSQPTRKLWEAIRNDTNEGAFKVLFNFIKGRLNRHPVFAGHFQRILETFLFANRVYIAAFDKYKDGIIDVIRFAIDNVDILAYQHFLCNLGIEHRHALDNELHYPLGVLVTEILKCAAYYSLPLYNPRPIEYASRCIDQRRRLSLYFQRCRAIGYESGVIGIDGKLLPLPIWCREPPPADSTAVPGLSSNKPKYEERLKQFGTPPERDRELANRKAYLLLLSVRQMTERAHIWDVIQSPEGNYQNIRYLLTCGVYCEETSIVSMVAFKLLKTALFGSNPPDTEVKSLWGIKEVESIVDEYAKEIEFGLCPTPKMRAAFPIFWNRRYANLTPRGRSSSVTFKLFLGSDGRTEDFSLDAKGMTPLELYGRYLIDEPSLSDQLCYAIGYVLLRYEESSNRLRKQYSSSDSSVECQKAIIQKDADLFHMLRTNFCWGDGKTQINMSALKSTIALENGSLLFSQKSLRGRIPLSGWGPWLAAFLRDTDMFLLNGGAPAGNMAETAAVPSADDAGDIARRRDAITRLWEAPPDAQDVLMKSQRNMLALEKIDPL
jgi:hypothetical protein